MAGTKEKTPLMEQIDQLVKLSATDKHALETILGMVVTEDAVLRPVALDTKNINNGTLYEEGVAYLAPPYYYLYRGLTTGEDFEKKVPGIYLSPTDHYIWIPVTEHNEDDKWLIEGKFATADSNEIINLLIKKDDIQLNIPESGKVFRPDELETDDILKRAIKRTLRAKNINLDNYRQYFTDKNALFNFKQVVKNPNSRLSMLLFERGCSALHLKYTVTVEEIDPEHPLGNKLDTPIQICSEDTYSV